MKSLEDFISIHARHNPDKIAIIHDGDNVNYRQLWDCIIAKADQFSLLGKRTVVVRASRSISFLIDYFAVHLSGKVIVPLENDAKDDYIASITDLVENSNIPEDVTDILFTTGTTGHQKGAMLSGRSIMRSAENLIDAHGYNEGLTFIINGPLNHIGSLSKVWSSIVVGACIEIIDGIKDLNALFGAIASAADKVATFLVPASIRMVLQFGRRQLEEVSEKIEFIETGAAPISQSDMEDLCQVLPNSRLYNTYASTETGIISSHDYNNDCRIAGCLGRMMKHSVLNIGTDGLINCSGPTIMSGYVSDEQLTRQVLRDGVVYTNDKGRIDEDGRLHLIGREGDIINIGGYKVNPVEVEGAANSYPGVVDCLCVKDAHPVLGYVLRLLVVMEDGAVLNKRSLASHLMALLEQHKIPQMYSQVPSIERTYNGKLNRKFYNKT